MGKWEKWLIGLGILLIIIFLISLTHQKLFSGKSTKTEIIKPQSPIEPHHKKPTESTFAQISKQNILTLKPKQKAIVKKTDGQILRLRKGNYVNFEVQQGKYYNLVFIGDSGLKSLPRAKAKLKIVSVEKDNQLILKNTGKEEIKVKIKIS